MNLSDKILIIIEILVAIVLRLLNIIGIFELLVLLSLIRLNITIEYIYKKL